MDFDNLPKNPIIISGDIERIEDNSRTFKYCGEIIIEDGVKEIGGWAFAWCTVDKATIPSTVVKIEENPFAHTYIFNVICKSPFYEVSDDALIEKSTKRLVSFVGKDRYSGKNYSAQRASDNDTSVRFEYTIPSYVKIIGEGSFRGRKLDKIIIPSTVKKILQNPFVYCDAEVENHSPNYKLENGLLIEIDTNTLLSYVKREKDIIVPDGVEIIEGSSFELLEYGVNSITLPHSIKEIRGNFGAECHIQHIYVPLDKLEFFKSLLPDYKDIISVKGAKANELVQSDHINSEKSVSETKTQSIIEDSSKEDNLIQEEVKRDFKAPKDLITFTFLFCLIIGCAFSYLLGSLCSWNFNLYNWNIVSTILASTVLLLTIVFSIVVSVYTYKSERKDFEYKVRIKHNSLKDKVRIKKQIQNKGGMSNVYNELITSLGYPIVKEEDNWISLKISAKSSIKIEKPDWNHLLVTYNVDEPTMHIVQIQSFKTNGYMPMVSSEEVIVQTVKEKIWNLGLGEKPVSSVRSENIYSEHATLIRDLYIIAYRNQGKITTSVDSIIKSFASKRYFDGHIVDDIKDAVIWNNGYSSANILDCYPEYEYSKEKYMEDLISIYNYTLLNNSSKGAFNYLCEVANTLGYDKTKISL